MLLIALSVAGTAGYFSVWGLSQLFAGASTAVIIMASILEISKIVTTTALHRYWSQIGNGLRTYLTIGVLVLMLITSAGIYGFLSNAYQKTANKLEIHEGELGVLESKKILFEKNISDNEKIALTKNKRIDQLTNLRITQENRLDSAKTNKTKDKVRADIALATNEIQKLSNDIDGLNGKNAILSDSVGKYNLKELELKSGSEVSGEVGPLKYIAELTGIPMSKIVNYLILLVIFVFDPLAIALILITNRVFQLEGDSNPLERKFKIAKNIEEVKKKDVLKNNEHIEPSIQELVEESAEEPKEVENIEFVEESQESNEIEIETPVYKKEPVVTTGRVELEDIKEIKENRGFSVNIPQSRGNNTIQRIGSNKIVKNGENNKFFFRRK